MNLYEAKTPLPSKNIPVLLKGADGWFVQATVRIYSEVERTTPKV